MRTMDVDGRQWTIEEDLERMTAVIREGGAIIASTSSAPVPGPRHRAWERLHARTESMIAHARVRAEPERRIPAAPPPPPNGFLAYARAAIRYKFMREHWSIAWRFGDAPFRELVPPRNRLWADPFVVAAGSDAAWIFVEELVYPEKRGFISVLEVRRDGTHTQPRPVLERPYHLSYPCVFSWNGEWLMVPESSANRTIELYRATDFPWKWELDRVLMHDLRAVDATVFEAHGRWWMYFATPGSDRDKDFDRLWLHHGPTPRGPWQPHRLNPLFCDVVGGRPGGRPFLRDGKLLRAAQVGTPWYGYAMQLREIVTLTPGEWEERELEILESRRAGTHTLNVDGGVTVTDHLRFRWGSRRAKASGA